VTGFETLPGETPIDDLSGLKARGLTTRAELNQVEAESIRKAYVKYLAGKPRPRSARFDLEWALQLHQEMLGDVWEWAGKARTSEKNIGEAPQQIQIALRSLMDDLAYWKEQGIDLLKQAVWLHHRAVKIHPFENGNGRWARLLANIWLKLHDHPPTEWPEATIGTESVIRAAYIEALKLADNGDYGALLELHKRYTE
jgi:Fic-DOC domain mobile mystery protein B